MGSSSRLDFRAAFRHQRIPRSSSRPSVHDGQTTRSPSRLTVRLSFRRLFPVRSASRRQFWTGGRFSDDGNPSASGSRQAAAVSDRPNRIAFSVEGSQRRASRQSDYASRGLRYDRLNRSRNSFRNGSERRSTVTRVRDPLSRIQAKLLRLSRFTTRRSIRKVP